jgi:hypothetical protein
MSWSLRVSNGDLVLGGTSFSTVTGEEKLVQDLRHYLLEQMGTDPMHPTYGSVIDGGTLPNGQIVESPIARIDWRNVTLEIEAEIRRIAAEYQRRQLERAKRDRHRYHKTTLSAGEILAEVRDITFTQDQDTLYVEVEIESGRSNPVLLDLTLPAPLTI